MRNYPLKMDEYDIGRDEYLELVYFCRQYPDKKVRLQCAISSGNQALSGMPHNPNVGDPVYASMIRRMPDMIDCELIEQSAIAAAPDMYQYLIRNVTLGEPFYKLNAPCCQTTFTKYRRMFFYILWYKRKEKMQKS